MEGTGAVGTVKSTVPWTVSAFTVSPLMPAASRQPSEERREKETPSSAGGRKDASRVNWISLRWAPGPVSAGGRNKVPLPPIPSWNPAGPITRRRKALSSWNRVVWSPDGLHGAVGQVWNNVIPSAPSEIAAVKAMVGPPSVALTVSRPAIGVGGFRIWLSRAAWSAARSMVETRVSPWRTSKVTSGPIGKSLTSPVANMTVPVATGVPSELTSPVATTTRTSPVSELLNTTRADRVNPMTRASPRRLTSISPSISSARSSTCWMTSAPDGSGRRSDMAPTERRLNTG